MPEPRSITATDVSCQRSPLGTFAECPHCAGEMRPEHAHYRCAGCGWRDSCSTEPGHARRPSPPDMGHDDAMGDRHTFRFAAQLSKGPEGTARSWAEQARQAEDLGYSALLMPDHFGDQLAPAPALAAAAAATTTLRVGSLVFGNDYRNPFVLAKEAATLDVLSEGRFEISLGAGWMKTDYEEAGLTYDTPRVRVERFEEAVQVVQGLLRTDGPFSFDGPTTGCTSTPCFPGRSNSRVRRSSSGAAAGGCCPSRRGTPTSSASMPTCATAPGVPRPRPTCRPSARGRRWAG